MKERPKKLLSAGFTAIFLSLLIISGAAGGFAQELNKKEILEQQFRIRKQLHPSTGNKIEQSVKTFVSQLPGAEMGIFYDRLTSMLIREQFPSLTVQEAKILEFFVICQAATNLEDDIRLIAREIEAMNRAKDKLEDLIKMTNRWIERETRKSFMESKTPPEELQKREETPLLKKDEGSSITPHLKVEYPRMPEISYPENLEEMGLPELEVELYRLKVALNSLHELSRSGIQALNTVNDLWRELFQTLSAMSRTVAGVPDSLIRDIR